ncbi:MAG: VOC family protein [Burkholderiales bacterium]|nr:VOC family protein [Burkholderiales bacterium]
MYDTPIRIQGLHHNAWRCSDSGRTRRFYEDFLGLPLVHAFEITETRTQRATHALHSFYELGDGSFLAFFEVPDMPFDFKPQHDFDLHIALEVERPVLDVMRARAQLAGIEVRGITNHGFIHSLYLRDPDGYVVELSAPVKSDAGLRTPAQARQVLARWQQQRGREAAAADTPNPGWADTTPDTTLDTLADTLADTLPAAATAPQPAPDVAHGAS